MGMISRPTLETGCVEIGGAFVEVRVTLVMTKGQYTRPETLISTISIKVILYDCMEGLVKIDMFTERYLKKQKGR